MSPSGLGRGLSALIPEKTEDESVKSSAVNMISIKKIMRNENQPRTQFEKQALEELCESIKQFGVLQPLLLTPQGDSFKVVAGERRLRASIMAGLKEVPAVIKEFEGKELLQAALIENIQREDLSELECAKAYRTLSDDFGMTQEQIAKGVGKSRSAVTNTMRLLALPEKVQKMVDEKKLSGGHARAVLTLEDEKAQVEFAELIEQKALSVRDAERLSKNFSSSRVKQKTVAARENKPPYLMEFEQQLSEALGSKVAIEMKQDGGGSVKIDFYSNEDLERIIETLTIS